MVAKDTYSGKNYSVSGPALDGFEITPSDTEVFPILARAIYVGGSGDVTVVSKAGDVLVFKNASVQAVGCHLGRRR
ncbi:MAG: hypothetical protein L3J15_05845 [Devosiaceae bacterium]|nr:hypothetical protein [Devosiaceae bacterium]